MPRFVILEHDHPVLHWDLMLEAGDVLQTWRLPRPPALGLNMMATALGEHRRAYLDYEGPVSGGRGVVKRWDAGEFHEEADSSSSSRRLHLKGALVGGSVWLDHIKEATWMFRWESA